MPSPPPPSPAAPAQVQPRAQLQAWPREQVQVAPTTVAAVLGTYLLFAGFLAVTLHVAARNVLGDVTLENALLVGPVPAAVSMVGVGAGAFPPLVALAALVADLVVVERVYDLDRRTAAYVTFIHAVVTVIVAAVGGALLALALQGPPQGAPPTGS